VISTRDGTSFPATVSIVREITVAFALEDAAGVLGGGHGALVAPPSGLSFEAIPIDLSEIALPEPPATRLTLHPTYALYERGNDVQVLIRNLGDLGPLDARCLLDDVPPLDAFDARLHHPMVEVVFGAHIPQAAIYEVFEWSGEDCRYALVEGEPQALEQIDFDAILAGLDDAAAVEPAALEAEAAPTSTELDMPAAPIAPVAVVDAPHGKQKQQATIRVESEKVDRLINLMGEAVIAQAMLAARIGDLPHASGGGVSLLGEMQALMREIQEGVMAIRAQPVKPVFMRMARVIREAGAATGKKVNLELVGEATEVDTTVIENLSDPLTHMIRNAIDHGIETPEKRIALGKPETGTIRLSAQHA
jgi:two-component system chemotaxis sensor kinase CheA